MTFHPVGNVIIPTVFHSYFSEGLKKPPTSWKLWWASLVDLTHKCWLAIGIVPQNYRKSGLMYVYIYDNIYIYIYIKYIYTYIYTYTHIYNIEYVYV